MPVIIRNADFRVVSQSKNLRGILAYSRQHAPVRVDCFGPSADGKGQLGIAWADGASCVTDFASYAVMRNWVSTQRCFRHLTQKPCGPYSLTVSFTEGGN